MNNMLNNGFVELDSNDKYSVSGGVALTTVIGLIVAGVFVAGQVTGCSNRAAEESEKHEQQQGCNCGCGCCGTETVYGPVPFSCV